MRLFLKQDKKNYFFLILVQDLEQMPHEEVFEMSVSKLETETSLLLEREEVGGGGEEEGHSPDNDQEQATSIAATNSPVAKSIFVKKVQSSAEMR